MLRDAYGVPVRASTPRHWRCRCPVPCQRRFRCASKGHRGKRSTPWCYGGEGEFCDTCWARRATPTKGPQ